MSGPARPLQESDDPALDPGVLVGPVVEWNGWQGVRKHGGLAILPWRGDHLAAVAAGITTVGDGAGLAAGSVAQALVRIQKGKDATWATLQEAWRALAHDGRLLIAGDNELGIVTWVKRVAAGLQQPGDVLANHSRARVACFRRSRQPEGLAEVGSSTVALSPPLPGEPASASIVIPPGVFGHRLLDGGTALLIAQLAQEISAQRILDLGCGAGHLALNALQRWPSAQAWLVDADARAVAAANANLTQLGLSGRATVTWWDVNEPLPTSGFDLVLNNPPCHSGTAIDYTVARTMFRLAFVALAPGGRLLVVANRKLPYERDLAAFGSVEVVNEQAGFKLLALRRD